MKKVLILACAALTACTNDIDLGPNKEQVETLSNAIGFQMAKKNMTTTKAAQTLQSQGHYNFGVWGYKSSDADHAIMANYLVGFGDAINGYKMNASTQTTWGDATASAANGKSQWAYENLGSSDYTYDGSEGYYKNDQTPYMSNIANQYLRYWDLSAATTNFYAYAPYVNKTATSTEVSFVNNTKTMTFPDGSIEAGYKPTDNEYMCTAKQVKSEDYGKDVSLVFKRLNSKINIKFYEDIAGYNVQILDLSNAYKGVYAKPAKRTGTAAPYTYSEGKLMTKTGVTITFDETTLDATPSDWKTTAINQSDKCLTFAAPTANPIGTTSGTASESPTTYYAIPKNEFAFAAGTDADLKDVGFTFHVTYKLISDTDEKITVNDATVFVPADKCKWECNKAYTYIFKITKNSNGSTDPSKPINPDNPTPDTDKALYPIVFDGCTVADYETGATTEHEITDGTFNYYLTLSASTLSKGASTPTSITVNAYKTHGTTDTFATSGELKIFDSSNIEKTTDFTITTSTSVAPTISTATAVNDTYTLRYTSGTKVLEAKFRVTD